MERKDILDINNPNSILSKYIENETKEMKEWAEEKRFFKSCACKRPFF